MLYRVYRGFELPPKFIPVGIGLDTCWIYPVVLTVRLWIGNVFPVASRNSVLVKACRFCIGDGFKPVILDTRPVLASSVEKQINARAIIVHHGPNDLVLRYR